MKLLLNGILSQETKPRKYPFEEMKVGDYIEFPDYSRKNMNLVATKFRNWARYKNRDRKAVTDKVNDKIILTRVA